MAKSSAQAANSSAGKGILFSAMLTVLFGILFRVLCDHHYPEEVPTQMTFENHTDRDIEMCWIGTITDADLNPMHCFEIPPRMGKQFNLHLWHMHLVREKAANTTNAQPKKRAKKKKLWHLMVALPGQKVVKVDDSLSATGPIDSQFVLRTALRAGLHPYYPVRWINRNRNTIRPILFLVVLLIAIFDFLRNKSQSKKEKSSSSIEPPPNAVVKGGVDSQAKGNLVHRHQRENDTEKDEGARVHPAGTFSFSTNDVMKFVAFFFMVLDHSGRCLNPPNLWWRVVSRAFSMPLFFFLNGFGSLANKHNDSLRVLAGFGILFYVFRIRNLAQGTVLFSHALIIPILNRVSFGKLNTATNAGIIVFLLILQPVVGDGLMFDAGSAPFLYAIAGQVRAQTNRSFAFFLYLLAATADHASNSFRTEYRANAMSTGSWDQALLPGIIAMVLFIPSFYWCSYHERKPIAVSKNTAILAFQKCMRFCSRYALELYVVHVTILDYAENYLSGEVDRPEFLL